MPQDIVSDIQALLEGKAEGRYGLTFINQQQHALQAAWLAEQEERGDALVTASLLHDIGHLVHNLGDNPADAGIDDRHEELGHAWLVNHFGPEVTEPVRRALDGLYSFEPLAPVEVKGEGVISIWELTRLDPALVAVAAGGAA